MNGVHDLGGMHGMGPIQPEMNEPVFHARWEERVFAMVRAMGAAGAYNIDTSRFYRESLPPHIYLASSYYRKWLLGLEDNLVAKGFVTAPELAAGHANERAKPLKNGKFGLQPGWASSLHRQALQFASSEYQRLASSAAATTPANQAVRERLQQKAIQLRIYADQAP